MHIQNNDITPATSQNYIWHPITKKLYTLTADTVRWCTKILFPIDFRFLSIKKNTIPWSYSAPFVPPNTPYTH